VKAETALTSTRSSLSLPSGNQAEGFWLPDWLNGVPVSGTQKGLQYRSFCIGSPYLKAW
jgi:hypothetical protein